MMEGVEIKGGAGEFEAAVVAVVLDHINRQEAEARRGRSPFQDPRLPAWLRAVYPEPLDVPLEQVRPD